jgi:hypothetical protein
MYRRDTCRASNRVPGNVCHWYRCRCMNCTHCLGVLCSPGCSRWLGSLSLDFSCRLLVLRQPAGKPPVGECMIHQRASSPWCNLIYIVHILVHSLQHLVIAGDVSRPRPGVEFLSVLRNGRGDCPMGLRRWVPVRCPRRTRYRNMVFGRGKFGKRRVRLFHDDVPSVGGGDRCSRCRGRCRMGGCRSGVHRSRPGSHTGITVPSRSLGGRR